MKTCTKCNVEKSKLDFCKDKSKKDGLATICKSCRKIYSLNNADKIKEYQKQYAVNNKEMIKEMASLYYKEKLKYKRQEDHLLNPEKRKNRDKKYRLNNIEKISKRVKDYRRKNKERIAEKNKIYRINNSERINNQRKNHREINRERLKNKQRLYYINNTDKARSSLKKYYAKNKDKIRAYLYLNRERRKENRRRYNKERLANDEFFSLKERVRGAIKDAFRNSGYTKKHSSSKILGCTWEELKLHIENKFTEGMSWDNRGEWHIDHYYPSSKARDEYHLLELNHYSNLRPMWAKENIKKSDNIPDEFLHPTYAAHNNMS
jgi:hypothetical protein